MSPRRRPGAFVSYRNPAQSVPGTMRIEGSNRRLSLHRTSPLARFRALKVRKQKEGRRLRHESRDSPSFPTMYGGRETLPDDHKFRGQRGRVRARYRRPQLGRGTEKIGETSQRKTNLQLASGAFSCKVAPFTPAGERTKKAPSRGGRTGSNGQQHPVVIDCEVLQKRRSRCTTPGDALLGASSRPPLRAARKRQEIPPGKRRPRNPPGREVGISSQ